jgi:fatty-acyl-CoA synthase
MAPVLALAAGVAATALAGYGLDTRYSIREDIAQIRAASKQKAYWNALVKIHGDDDWSFYHILHRTRGQNDYEEAFLFEDRSWTYAELRGEIGRLAQAFQALGIQNRTVVGMFINNSPEFYFTWWALFKIGAIAAPINTSISQEPFRHCLKISEAEFLICSFELIGVAASSLDINEASSLMHSNVLSDSRLPRLTSVLMYDYDSYPKLSAPSLIPQGVCTIVHKELPAPTPAMSSWDKEVRPKVGPNDTSQYLFTSGTTGLPKAATWPCGGSLMGGSPWRWPHMFKKHRRTYLCTPLFHGGAT